jgi:hypothetical protein
MRHFKIGMLLFALFIMTDCEKKANSINLDNLTGDAKIVGFVTEKCSCCWGWVIEIGSNTIKADSIPGLSPSESINFPINVTISIGNQTRDCSELSKSAYYEIKQCTLIN